MIVIMLYTYYYLESVKKKEGLFNSSNNRRGGGFLSRSSEQCNLFFVTDFTSSITLRHATKLYTVTH